MMLNTKKSGIIYMMAFMLSISLVLFYGNGLAQDTHGNETAEEHAAHAGTDVHEDHGEEEGHEEPVVSLTPAEIEEFGLMLAIAGPGVLYTEIEVPGEVVANNDRLAHIAPRFPGVVTEVRKTIGDPVARGEILAVVESNEGLTPYHIKSLLNGTVIDKHITIGEVKSGDEPAFVIADLGTVWVNLSIYQMNLAGVKVGMTANLSFGEGIPHAEGVISYISPIIDRHTRTATARVVLPNPEGLLRPGLFVVGRIKTAVIDIPLLVPLTAVQTFENESVIFIQTDEGFEIRHITTGRSNQSFIEITGGLPAGETFVADGGFVLKAELGKGEFGHDHAH